MFIPESHLRWWLSCRREWLVTGRPPGCYHLNLQTLSISSEFFVVLKLTISINKLHGLHLLLLIPSFCLLISWPLLLYSSINFGHLDVIISCLYFQLIFIYKRLRHQTSVFGLQPSFVL
jgi:hypothetical protein